MRAFWMTLFALALSGSPLFAQSAREAATKVPEKDAPTKLVPKTEELWVTPIARLKGNDYLIVVDMAAKETNDKQRTPPRRLRTTSSLPLFIEEMAESAERVKGQLYMRVRVTVIPEAFDTGERTEDLKILMVCLLPEKSKSHLTELTKWSDFPEPLPKERMVGDPFPSHPNSTAPSRSTAP